MVLCLERLDVRKVFIILHIFNWYSDNFNSDNFNKIIIIIITKMVFNLTNMVIIKVISKES